MMPVFLIILIVAASGYAFVSSWHVTRYLIARQDGQRLYLLSFLYGLLTLAGSCVAWIFSQIVNKSFDFSIEAFNKFLDIVLIPMLVLTLFLGISLGQILNLIPRSKQFSLKNAIKSLGLDFEKIMYESVEEEKALFLTMENGKVYVGFLLSGFDPSLVDNQTFAILPVKSGYRDKDTKKVIFTTDYVSNYDKFRSESKNSEITQDDYRIVLFKKDVKSVSLYHQEIYDRFQEDENLANNADSILPN